MCAWPLPCRAGSSETHVGGLFYHLEVIIVTPTCGPPRNRDIKYRINGRERCKTSCRIALVGTDAPSQCTQHGDSAADEYGPTQPYASVPSDLPPQLSDFFFQPGLCSIFARATSKQHDLPLSSPLSPICCHVPACAIMSGTSFCPRGGRVVVDKQGPAARLRLRRACAAADDAIRASGFSSAQVAIAAHIRPEAVRRLSADGEKTGWRIPSLKTCEAIDEFCATHLDKSFSLVAFRRSFDQAQEQDSSSEGALDDAEVLVGSHHQSLSPIKNVLPLTRPGWLNLGSDHRIFLSAMAVAGRRKRLSSSLRSTS